MKIKEVADLVGVDPKEVVTVVEDRRDELTGQGYKLAKRLNAGSALQEDVVRIVLAEIDQRRQAVAAEEHEKDKKRLQEEEERKRIAAEREREKELAEVRAKQEAERRRAQEDFERRQAEMQRQEAEQAAQKAAQDQEERQRREEQQREERRRNLPARAPRPAAARDLEQRVTAQDELAALQERLAKQDAEQRRAHERGVARRRVEAARQDVARATQEWQQVDKNAEAEERADKRRDRRREDAPRGTGRRDRPAERGDRGDRGGASAPRGGGAPAGGPGRKGGDKKDDKPAKANQLERFVQSGLGESLDQEFTRGNRRRRGGGKDKGATTNEGDKDGGSKRPKGGDGRKRIRPTQVFKVDALSRKPHGGGKRKSDGGGGRRRRDEPKVEEPKVFRFTGDFTVGEFADKIGVPISDIMKKLFMSGHMLTINQIMDPDMAEEVALEFEREIEIVRESDEFDIEKFIAEGRDETRLQPRPPIVTIMGHVDHGKTTLLDYIRKTDVAEGEHGGITQHIGAYYVNSAKGDIAFVDTPGHEAFTEMRMRGANVTDLVVLVVAANDGVMPQTVEAINHSRAAEVPILVAITKIDVEGANVERIKQQLMKYELVPEEYGGETIIVPVSAKSGKGIDDLLESIALQTEILELKADPDRKAVGTIVESHVDPHRGAVATVLVEEGNLNVGDIFVCGSEYGRVRAMRDDRNQQVKSAGPAHPVEILGLTGSPAAGEKFVVVPSEADAREIAEKREARRRSRSATAQPHVTLENLADRMSDDEAVPLNLIVKGDVQGSVEAICSALLKIRSDKVIVKILHSAVGAVSYSDVQLAETSEAIILAFNVRPDVAARDFAEEAGVDIRSYKVIYALLEDIEKAMLGMLAPEYEERDEARLKVLDTFKASKVGTIAGCFVEEGTVNVKHKARLVRDGAVIFDGTIASLRRVKDDVKTVLSGLECGMSLQNFNDIKVDDIIETYSMIEKKASLVNEELRQTAEAQTT